MTDRHSLSWYLAAVLGICILCSLITGVGFTKAGEQNAGDTAFLAAVGFLIILWRLGEAEYARGSEAT